jgi:hypothetical protein
MIGVKSINIVEVSIRMSIKDRFLKSRMADVLSVILTGGGLILVIIGVAYTLQNMQSGNSAATSHYSSFVTAFGTIVLVGVTLSYASISNRIADEHRQDRQQRREQREDASKGLRRALRNEIESDSNYDDAAEWSLVELISVESWRNDRMYLQNATRMHLLTGPEIEKIVEFYTKQKSVDDICSSYEDMDDLPEDTGRLHERIRNELRELDTAQQEAISEIEQHIND